MTEQLWYLKQCDLFRGLRAEELAPLEAVCRSLRLARGEPIYLPADPADCVLLLTTGRAKTCGVTDEGKQAILSFIEPGELLGELALVRPGAPREEFAEAIEKTSALRLPGAVLSGLLERHPALALGLSRLLGERRQRIERRLRSLLFRSNRQRLISVLLELIGRYGQPTDGGTTLRIRLSHQDLAGMIGSTRETVTVLLGELQAEGLLRTGRRRITVASRDRLRSAAARSSASTVDPPPFAERSGAVRLAAAAAQA